MYKCVLRNEDSTQTQYGWFKTVNVRFGATVYTKYVSVVIAFIRL